MRSIALTVAALLLACTSARGQSPPPASAAAATGLEDSIRSWVADQRALVPTLEQEVRREEAQVREFRGYLQRIRTDAAGQKAMLALGDMRPFDLSRARNNWIAWRNVGQGRAARVEALTKGVAQRKQEQNERWDLLGDDVVADLAPEAGQIYQQAQVLQKQTLALLDRLQALAANGAHDVETAVSVCDDVLGLLAKAGDKLRARFFLERVTLASVGTAREDLRKDVAAFIEPLADALAEHGRARLGEWLRANAQVLVTAVLLLSLAIWRAHRGVVRLEVAARRLREAGSSFLRRLGMAMLLTLARVAGLAVVTAATYLFEAVLGTSAPDWVRMPISIVRDLFVWRLIVTFLRVAFDASATEHRLLELDDATAELARRRLERLAWWILLGAVTADLVRYIGVPSTPLMLGFLVVQLAGVRSVLRSLSDARLAALALPGPWANAARQWRGLVRGATVVVVGTAAFGFVNLAFYISWAVVEANGLLLFSLLVWRAGREVLDEWFPAVDVATQRSVRRLWGATVIGFSLLALPLLDGFGGALLHWGERVLAMGVDISGQEITLGKVFASLLWVVSALALSRLTSAVLNAHVFPRASVDAGVRAAITATVGYLLLAAGVLLGIRALGFDLTSLAIVAGALSVGVGFGMQTLVSNFVSGLIILYERPFRPGDILDLGGVLGSVKKIRTRSTIVQTYDDAEVVLPNAELLSKPITNWTLSNHRTRALIPISVAYGSDVHLVRDTLLEIAAAHPRIAEPPKVVFSAFGDSALEFRLLIWVDIREKVDVVSDLYFSIDEAFREKRIEIPFPQRDVHVYSTSGGG